MGKRILKIFLIFTVIMVTITSVYLMIGAGNSSGIYDTYDSVRPDSRSGFDTKLYFVQAYTLITGDTTLAKLQGLSDEDIAAMATGSADINEIVNGNMASSGTGIISVTGELRSDDITAASRAVCQSYITNYSSELYVSSSSDECALKPYGVVECNGRNLSPYITDGNVYNRCCNGLSSGILFLCGISKYNDGSNISQSWPYISCPDIWNRVGTQYHFTTFGELEVGDIICFSGHVETVVKKDETNVYIANAGSTRAIVSTANNGYQHYHTYDTLLTSYYTSRNGYGNMKGVVRP